MNTKLNSETSLGSFASKIFYTVSAAALLGVTALAAPDAPIPLDQLGAVAQQQYQGDGLGVSATPEGAQLRCVFQRLSGRVTPEGLWLESTEPGGSQLHLRATAIGRETGQWSADIPVGLTPPNQRPAPGATGPCTPQAGSPSDSLAEWQGGDTAPWISPALSTLNPQPSTLLPTGTVSVQDGRVQFHRPGLVEEYSVSMDGVRQDFVVLERPPLTPSLSPADGEKISRSQIRALTPRTAEHLLSRPSATLSSIPNGGEGRGEEALWCMERMAGRPGEGPLRVELELTGARAEALPNGVRLTLDGSGRELTYSRLRVTDATGRDACRYPLGRAGGRRRGGLSGAD